MNPQTRELVYARQGGYCWWCGGALPERWALHHRQLRKQGGSDEPHNLVALHHECHNVRTGSVHLTVRTAVERGFLVPSWDDPATVSLRIHGGETVRLHPDGTTTREAREHEHGW